MELCQTTAQAVFIPLRFYQDLPGSLIFALFSDESLHFDAETVIFASRHQKNQVGDASDKPHSNSTRPIDLISVAALVFDMKKESSGLRMLVPAPLVALRLQSCLLLPSLTLIWSVSSGYNHSNFGSPSFLLIFTLLKMFFLKKYQYFGLIFSP